jgi:hypothetical protein
VLTETADGTIWQDPTYSPTPMSVPTTPPVQGPTVPTVYVAGQSPIGVLSCVMNIEAFSGLQSAVSARYRDLDARPIAQVTFRIPFGVSALDYVDKGDIEPGRLIYHVLHRHLSVVAPGFHTLDEAPTCTVVNATYADGTIWRNPAVSQDEPPPRPKRLNQEFYIAAGTGKWRNGAMP